MLTWIDAWFVYHSLIITKLTAIITNCHIYFISIFFLQILGPKFMVPPAESLAVIAANSNAIPYFVSMGGLQAVARSIATAPAVDLVAASLDIPCLQVNIYLLILLYNIL